MSVAGPAKREQREQKRTGKIDSGDGDIADGREEISWKAGTDNVKNAEHHGYGSTEENE